MFKNYSVLISKLAPIHIAVMTLLFALVNLVLRWPGELPPDSIVMLHEAISGEFTDWQPPVTTLIWRWLLTFTEGGQPMLVLQVGLHWLGIGLFAGILAKKNHTTAALVMLLSGFTPIALMYTGVVMKDSLFASLFIAAFGLASLENMRFRIVGLFIGILGMLTRANAVFAFPSLLMLLFRVKRSLFKSMLFIALAALALIPLSQWFNHSVLAAERTGVERSLQIYDLTGIAYFSEDPSVLPVEILDLESCYTPLYWDTLVKTRCDKAFGQIEGSITRDWIMHTLTHPIAYLQHRLYHFNYEIFFLVPPVQQCVEAPEAHDCPRSLLSDFVTKNALLWPVTWLALGLVMLFSRLEVIPRALVLSALAYGMAYILVGVAANFRYFYWTELAIQTALIYQIAIAGFPKWKIALAAVSTVVLLGYLWRLGSLL